MKNLLLGLFSLGALLALSPIACSGGGGNDDDCPPNGCVGSDDDDISNDDDDDDDDDVSPDCGDGDVLGEELCEIGDEERCEDPNGYEGFRTCANDCLSWSACDSDEYCGDGKVNGWESCDDGPGEGEGACADDCSAVQACGNGVLEGTEICEATEWLEGEPSDALHLDPCCVACVALVEDDAPCDAVPDNCWTGSCLEGVCRYEECPSPAGECGLAVCDPDFDRCVLSDTDQGIDCDQVHACRTTACAPQPLDPTKGICAAADPLEDGLSCDDDDPLTQQTVCLSGLCVPTACGDGLVAPGETCEPGQPEFCVTANGYVGINECLPDCSGWVGCAAEEYCGDGKINGLEACEIDQVDDCGSPGHPAKAACNEDCSAMGACVPQAYCGNGFVEPPEVCEPGTSIACWDYRDYEGTRLCRDDCAAYRSCLAPGFCGDGVRNGPEECDEAGPTFTCSEECKALDIRCGNGKIDPELNETCDEGTWNGFGPGYCNVDCSGVIPLSPDPTGGQSYALNNFLGDGVITQPANAQPFIDLFVSQGLVPALLFTFTDYIRQDQTLDAFGSFGETVFGQVVAQDLGKPSFAIDPGDYSAPPAFRLFFDGRRTFRFGLYRIDLVDLNLEGAFNPGGSLMNLYVFEGYIDTEDIKQALGMDLCLFFLCTPERLLFVRIEGLQAYQVNFPVQFIYP